MKWGGRSDNWPVFPLRNPGVLPPPAEGHCGVRRAEDGVFPEPERSRKRSALLSAERTESGTRQQHLTLCTSTNKYLLVVMCKVQSLGTCTPVLWYLQPYICQERVDHLACRYVEASVITSAVSSSQSQEEVCDLLHAAPFQNILPRVHVKGE